MIVIYTNISLDWKSTWQNRGFVTGKP